MWLRLLLLGLLFVCWGGCQPYADIPFYDELTLVAERSPDDGRAYQERQVKILTAIAAESYPAYRLGSGDIFGMRIYDNPDLDLPTSTITPDGYLSLPLVGLIEVGGRTMPEAVNVITEAYSKYLIDPKVALIPEQIVSSTATISGKINTAGCYPVNDKVRISDLIALARGPTKAERTDIGMTELIDLRSSLLIRNGEILPVDFTEAIERGNPLHNIRVYPGDYVYLATRSDKRISIMGEVGTPRFINWSENMGILEAIAMAGGFKDERSANLLVVRGGILDPQVYRLRIADLIDGTFSHIALEPGDIVYVPKDGLSEYNVFIRKLLPTGQLVNMFLTPAMFWIN